jgi:hypothetical protein
MEKSLDMILVEIEHILARCRSLNLSWGESDAVGSCEKMLEFFEHLPKEPWVFDRAADLRERVRSLFMELSRMHKFTF